MAQCLFQPQMIVRVIYFPQEGEEDRRRDGKIISRNGREWGLEIP